MEISIPIFTGLFFVGSISFCQICIGSLLFNKALHFVNTNFFSFLITLLTAVLSSFLCKARNIRYMSWAFRVICKAKNNGGYTHPLSYQIPPKSVWQQPFLLKKGLTPCTHPLYLFRIKLKALRIIRCQSAELFCRAFRS